MLNPHFVLKVSAIWKNMRHLVVSSFVSQAWPDFYGGWLSFEYTCVLDWALIISN